MLFRRKCASESASPQSSPVKANGEASVKAKYADVILEDYEVGIWRVLLSKTSGFRLKSFEQQAYFYKSLPHIRRLYMTAWLLSPALVLFYSFSSLWSGIEDAIQMYLSNEILRTIESGIVEKKPIATELFKAAVLRILCMLLISYIGRSKTTLQRKLSEKVTLHYELGILEANLSPDTYTDTAPDISGSAAWGAFEEVNTYAIGMVSAFSQLAVTMRSIDSSHGPALLLLSLGRPLIKEMFARSLWEKVCLVWINNAVYLRTKAIEALGTASYRQDVICGDLKDWIISEIQDGKEKLGDWRDVSPWSSTVHPLYTAIMALVNDGPTAICLLMSLSNPRSLSVATMAILQSSLSALRANISKILENGETVGEALALLISLHHRLDEAAAKPKPSLSYPPYASGESGMKFELRNLSYSYPGKENSVKALDNLDLTIPGGSVVVVVGANGSGKSTLIRILSCLSAPTSGEFLIDDHPAKDYNLGHLRQASVILSQDSRLYPLSLAENIGLGHVALKEDMDLIKEAAEKGGAAEFISKLDRGYATNLRPFQFSSVLAYNLPEDDSHPINIKQRRVFQRTNISGGEYQRIIAARSFMRLRSGKIKFIAVDEPSSALDAEGELQLFKELLAARKSKTVVFVTHRFGHLTKYADIILCMKEGRIVETGNHTELMDKNGEYAKLYNIQAGAFSDGITSS